MPDEPRLRIAEMFSSIQGEGIWIGVPSTFIRVSGCNLRCQWCDTPYASWAPEGNLVTLDGITEQAIRSGNSHVVLTGGEPMLFEPIGELTEILKSQGMTITIETAGTVFRDVSCDLMSISPKLANSTPSDPAWVQRHELTRLERAPLKRLLNAYNYQLKFVVDPDRPQDFAEIDALLAELGEIDRERILLMPEGTDGQVLQERSRRLVPLCIARGWRLTPRLHIDLFGNIRGT